MRPTRTLLSLIPILILCSCVATAPDALAERQRPAQRVVAPVPVDRQWEHDWVRGAVFYEIFVRSFADSNGDGIGDLNGLISKLDYLNDGNPATTADLGIDGIWLMPVFVSPSYHGYDTVDYENINPQYGTNEDFVRLCEEAHRRGIRVIVDFVINHSGSGHPWFQEAKSAPDSPKRDWYVWRTDDPGWKQPWNTFTGSSTWHPSNGWYYYGVFWSGMPDLNFDTPAVREEIKRLASLWISRGVDGYRLDATRYLVETGGGGGQADTPETHAMLKEFAAHVRNAKPDGFLVGENWTDTDIIADYFGSTTVIKGGDELPSNFNFPLSDQIVRGVSTGTAEGIALKMREVQQSYPQGVIDSPFLTNHDQARLATQLGNDAGKLRNAISILLTMPGTPFLYYGEEVALQNGPGPNDEYKRTPMPWTAEGPNYGFTTGTPWFQFAPGAATTNVASQTGRSDSLLTRYRNLIAARESSEALRKGDVEVLSSIATVLAFLRTSPAERVLVVHNLSDGFSTSGNLEFAASGFEKIFADSSLSDPSGAGTRWTVNLPPRTTGIWRLR
jgi:glycosidase